MTLRVPASVAPLLLPRRGHEDEHLTARARWTLAVAVPRAAMHAVPPVVAATATAGPRARWAQVARPRVDASSLCEACCSSRLAGHSATRRGPTRLAMGRKTRNRSQGLQTTHYALHTTRTRYFYKRAHSSAPATRQHILNALVRNPRDGAGGPKHRDARAEAPPEAAKATLCGHGA